MCPSGYSVLGPTLFILYTTGILSIPENQMIGYADDFTLLGLVERWCNREAVTKALRRDLVTIDGWCMVWTMKLNACKTKYVVLVEYPQLEISPFHI